jgi:lipoprotein-releasing system ATP-binding protein
MSNDLERILHEAKSQRRPLPINPNLHVVPRVHGGPPLEGGPKLKIARHSNSEENDAPPTPQNQPRNTPEASLAHEHPPLFNGPHFVPEEKKKPEETVKAAVAAPAEETTEAEEELEDNMATTISIVPYAKAPPAEAASSPKKSAEHLRTVGLHKSYRKGQVEVPVLRGVNVTIQTGEFMAIAGQSGSGKSTLLHLMGTLDSPDKGEIHFHGRRIDNISTQARDALRNKRIGMIFQFYHLLPELSTLENVLAPLMIAEGAWTYWKNRRKHHETAKSILELVGLSHRLKHKPRELSGGEMQRAAIARALIAQPELLFADEPTGNLDQGTGQEILKILRTLNDVQNLTIVMVTHDQALARQADRIVRLTGGVIE